MHDPAPLPSPGQSPTSVLSHVLDHTDSDRKTNGHTGWPCVDEGCACARGPGGGGWIIRIASVLCLFAFAVAHGLAHVLAAPVPRGGGTASGVGRLHLQRKPERSSIAMGARREDREGLPDRSVCERQWALTPPPHCTQTLPESSRFTRASKVDDSVTSAHSPTDHNSWSVQTQGQGRVLSDGDVLGLQTGAESPPKVFGHLGGHCRHRCTPRPSLVRCCA